MNKLLVLQHTQSEYLGQIEDHLEARRIGFQYLRPFADPSWSLKTMQPSGGLVLLGGGSWGCAGGNDLPSLQPELELCRRFLEDGLPVIGFGLGAWLLAIAAGGKARATSFRFELLQARRLRDDALKGFLPPSFAMVRYGRDEAGLPDGTEIFAEDADGAPAVFQIAQNCFGFAGNPGVKSAIIEDLLMEAELSGSQFDSPGDAELAETLAKLRAAQNDMARALNDIMVGIIQCTGWMD